MVKLHWDMALLQYLRSVPGEHLPSPGQSLVLAKGLIFRETTVARKFNPRILTVIQPKREKLAPQKLSSAKNTHYMVSGLPYFLCYLMLVVLALCSNFTKSNEQATYTPAQSLQFLCVRV